jgi:hypothetical protein
VLPHLIDSLVETVDPKMHFAFTVRLDAKEAMSVIERADPKRLDPDALIVPRVTKGPPIEVAADTNTESLIDTLLPTTMESSTESDLST